MFIKNGFEGVEVIVKNILFVVDERRMGGVSILLEDILNKFDYSKYNVDILVLHNSGTRLNNLPKNVNIIYGTRYFDAVDLTIGEVLRSKNLSLIFKKVRLVMEMKTGLIKKRIIKERKKIIKKEYDVEIAFKDGFTALFVGFGNCKNKIHWLQYNYSIANPNAKYDKLFKEVLPRFNKIIAVSKGVMDDFNKIYHLENLTRVISNYVDTAKIKKLSKNNKSKNKNIEFISVGRLHPMKGYDRLIEAVIRLKKDNLLNNVSFKIYGDGPIRDDLNNKIIEGKVDNCFKLMGYTDNPYQYICNSDMFILSSVCETFGIVIVEAMTLGIPVLATSNSATGELIKSGYNGLIVDNSTDGLYNGLKKVITNKDIIDTYKNNLKDYDYDKENERILKQIYKLFE